MHEQKFKDLLSSTCQVSPERIVLDLESEIMTGPGSIPTGVLFVTGIFCFHAVKSVMPILALLPTLFNYEKTQLLTKSDKVVCKKPQLNLIIFTTRVAIETIGTFVTVFSLESFGTLVTSMSMVAISTTTSSGCPGWFRMMPFKQNPGSSSHLL